MTGKSRPAPPCLCRQLLQVLSFLHMRRVVHRDVKPENVMLRGEGPDRIVLVDFGISRDLDRQMRTTTVVMATPAYAAPELQAGAAQAPTTTALDMFAVGIILLEARFPFVCCACSVAARNRASPVSLNHLPLSLLLLPRLQLAVGALYSWNAQRRRLEQALPPCEPLSAARTREVRAGGQGLLLPGAVGAAPHPTDGVAWAMRARAAPVVEPRDDQTANRAVSATSLC